MTGVQTCALPICFPVTIAGVCVPIYTKRALPGDTFDIEDIEMQIYTDPTERAMYGAYKMYIEFYFAPTRLYQAWLHNNKEYIGEDMSRAKLPLMDIIANGSDWNLTEQAEIQQIHPSSLLAHLGLRSLGQHVDGYSEKNPNVRGIFNAETMSAYRDWETDRKSTRLNSSHRSLSRMPSSA